ncbi:hypothetical protein [Virgibacillus sp. Bac330]|uniref:hypothetical protein n=1 Tax=Virgibacillus sp. Bac330 TaxID=2419841 RepID=UPI000EF4A5A8|nr:hypothetical protein [Virgibacillus sp. Bac330]
MFSFSLYCIYLGFFYGNPKKIVETEDLARQYLRETKGYQYSDIAVIRGNYNWKDTPEQKYGGVIILEGDEKQYYFYVENDKIIEDDKIPNKK